MSVLDMDSFLICNFVVVVVVNIKNNTNLATEIIFNANDLDIQKPAPPVANEK